MQDLITVWTDTGKIKVRKYYLTTCLRESLKTFFDLHSDEERAKLIGFSTFGDLRPKNVLLLGSTPRYQCKCMIHENLFLKLNAIDTIYNR